MIYSIVTGEILSRGKIFAIFILLAFFLVHTVFVFPGNDASSSVNLELKNGLQVFLYNKPTLPLTHFVFAFNVGSKDETDKTNGIVHILEHCILFRGTKAIQNQGFYQELRLHGAYCNAHTGRDLSIFEMTVPSEHSEFAFRTLREILFDFNLNQKELDNEKEVILEELNKIQDDPYQTAISIIYQNIFHDHTYQNPVYGKMEVIKELTAEDVMRFYDDYFVPSNCALAVVGDLSLDQMKEKTKSMLENIQKTGADRKEFQEIEPLKKTVKKNMNMDVEMAYLAIGLNAPGYNSPDQYAADLLAEIFGQGYNPLINQPILRRRIAAHSINMSYYCDKYGGALTLFIGMDPKDINAAESEITKYLKNSHKLNYSKTDYEPDDQFYAFDILQSAKNRIKFNAEAAEEKGLLIGHSLVRYMLMNKTQDRGDYLEKIEKLNSSDIRQAAGRYLSQKGKVIVKILPEGIK